jgi:hypothetical protein
MPPLRFRGGSVVFYDDATSKSRALAARVTGVADMADPADPVAGHLRVTVLRAMGLRLDADGAQVHELSRDNFPLPPSLRAEPWRRKARSRTGSAVARFRPARSAQHAAGGKCRARWDPFVPILRNALGPGSQPDPFIKMRILLNRQVRPAPAEALRVRGLIMRGAVAYCGACHSRQSCPDACASQSCPSEPGPSTCQQMSHECTRGAAGGRRAEVHDDYRAGHLRPRVQRGVSHARP